MFLNKKIEKINIYVFYYNNHLDKTKMGAGASTETDSSETDSPFIESLKTVVVKNDICLALVLAQSFEENLLKENKKLQQENEEFQQKIKNLSKY